MRHVKTLWCLTVAGSLAACGPTMTPDPQTDPGSAEAPVPAPDGYQAGGPALERFGIGSYRVTTSETHTSVALRDLAAHDAGRMDLERGPDGFAVALELAGHAFMQDVDSTGLVMKLTLDGGEATLYRTGDQWSGLPDALQMLADTREQMEVVSAIGAQARLVFGPTTPPATPPAANALNLCCSTIPVNASGWAWRWQQNAPAEACAAAASNLQLRCRFATAGLDCCNVPVPPPGSDLPAACNSCVDLFTGTLCTVTAYLNYVC